MPPEILVMEFEQTGDLVVYEQAIRQESPEVVVHVAASEEEALRFCGNVEIVAIKAHDLSPALVSALPRLEWVQSLTTGTDHLRTLSLPPGCVVTSTRGMHGPQMAELAFLHMLALARDFPSMYRNQQAKRWVRWPQPLLLGKTAVIVGVGAISEALAVRCKAFGMRVVGVSGSRTKADGFDIIEPRERLVSAASIADFLIVLAPYTPENHHLIDARVLGAMPPQAMLINIARGKVIDESAMIAALQEGRIQGAGLDVFEVEPLAENNPLWRMDRVIVTPRIGGMSDIFAKQAAAILTDNLKIFLSGRREAMHNIVRI